MKRWTRCTWFRNFPVEMRLKSGSYRERGNVKSVRGGDTAGRAAYFDPFARFAMPNKNDVTSIETLQRCAVIPMRGRDTSGIGVYVSVFYRKLSFNVYFHLKEVASLFPQI